MEDKRIDELVKKGLYSHKSIVSEDSWYKLEFILDSKQDTPKKGVWLPLRKVAAILFLVSVSWLSIEGFSYWTSIQQWRSDVSRLDIEQSYNKIPEGIGITKLLDHTNLVLSRYDVAKKVTSYQGTPDEELIVNTDLLVKKDDLQSSLSEEKLVIHEDVEIEQVRIVYKRSISPFEEELKQDSLKTNLVKELFHAARDFEPGELLADARSAKDKILRNPFGINNSIKGLNKKK